MSELAYPADDPPPVEPLPPDEGDCCGSGCSPCVWDLYGEERERYFAALRAWRERQARRQPQPGD